MAWRCTMLTYRNLYKSPMHNDLTAPVGPGRPKDLAKRQAILEAAKQLSSGAPGAVQAYWFAGVLPVSIFNYASSVIPVIFSVLALSYIHRAVDRVMPEVLRTVFTPTLTLFITALVALVVIGPVGIWLGKGLAWCIQGLFDTSSVLAGLIVGAIRPVAILTGMHHAMTPIALQNFSEHGYDMLMPMIAWPTWPLPAPPSLSGSRIVIATIAP